MKLSELKSALHSHPGLPLQFVLPDGRRIPEQFHVTEVGHVSKRFIDCGGTVRHVNTAQLQLWLGQDREHRLNSSRLEKILNLAGAVLPASDLDVEVEFEDRTVSQYPLVEAIVTGTALKLTLGDKHTDCLAKQSCGSEASTSETESACCGSACCT